MCGWRVRGCRPRDAALAIRPELVLGTGFPSGAMRGRGGIFRVKTQPAFLPLIASRSLRTHGGNACAGQAAKRSQAHAVTHASSSRGGGGMTRIHTEALAGAAGIHPNWPCGCRRASKTKTLPSGGERPVTARITSWPHWPPATAHTGDTPSPNARDTLLRQSTGTRTRRQALGARRALRGRRASRSTLEQLI